jgi:hypothetical protein
MSKTVIKSAWRLRDEVMERDLRAFWRETGLLPDTADAAQRARDLCVVAYDGECFVGEVEARIRRLQFVRARIAMLKVAVVREHRAGHLASEMVIEAQRLLERWSLEHPEEKVMGIGGVVQTRALGDKLREPIFKPFGLVLVGYTARGEQIRLAWFPHARVE